MQQTIFIADLIACSTRFAHHYAHHQELESIIQVTAAYGVQTPNPNMRTAADPRHEDRPTLYYS